jgi:hypothetical protein
MDQFSIADRSSCEKAIRNGGIAAMVSAGLTALLATVGIFTTSNNPTLSYYLDPWSLVDAALIVVLGIFIFRKSRTAATLMLAYFVVSKGIQWYDMGKPSGTIMSILFFMFYFSAMRATYAWHKTYKAEFVAPAA